MLLRDCAQEALVWPVASEISARMTRIRHRGIQESEQDCAQETRGTGCGITIVAKGEIHDIHYGRQEKCIWESDRYTTLLLAVDRVSHVDPAWGEAEELNADKMVRSRALRVNLLPGY